MAGSIPERTCSGNDHAGVLPRAHLRSPAAPEGHPDSAIELLRPSQVPVTGVPAMPARVLSAAGRPGGRQLLRPSRVLPGAAFVARRPVVPTRPSAVPASAVLDVLRGPGQPLPAPLKVDMGVRLGADLSGVRLHTGAAARASAAALGARAYTSGSHVVIGDRGGGQLTLAHELVHVIQQCRGAVAGTDNGDGLAVSDPSDQFERDAEATAVRALAGRPAASGPGNALPVSRLVRLGRQRATKAAVQRLSFRVKNRETGQLDQFDTRDIDGPRLLDTYERYRTSLDDDDKRAAEDMLRALKTRDFKDGKLASGRIVQLLVTTPDERMTEDIRASLRSLLELPQAEDPAATDIELMMLFNYPLVGNVRREQFAVLRWVLGMRMNAPGSGGLADLSIISDQVTGRPGFPKWTLSYFEGIKPTEHRRHIVAWHTLRTLMNSLIIGLGMEGAAKLLLALPLKVPQEVSGQAEALLTSVARVKYGDSVHGRTILKYLFIMSGNPRNLWPGSGSVNSALPGIFSRTREKLHNTAVPGAEPKLLKTTDEEKEPSPKKAAQPETAKDPLDKLIELAEMWAVEDAESGIDSTAHVTAGMAILKAWPTFRAKLTADNREPAWAGLIRLAEISLQNLEVDLQPGSGEEAARLGDKSRSPIPALGRLIHGEEPDPGLTLELFKQLLIYPEQEK